jgi:hypothetical protein
LSRKYYFNATGKDFKFQIGAYKYATVPPGTHLLDETLASKFPDYLIEVPNPRKVEKNVVLKEEPILVDATPEVNTTEKDVTINETKPVKRGRGRPKGSLNKKNR